MTILRILISQAQLKKKKELQRHNISESKILARYLR